MLVASDKNHNKILAWQAKRGDNFYCPECNNEVILKSGKIKVAHFAHKPDAIDCPYRQGETELHLRIKREIYEALVNYPDCYRCELERRLDGVRPDVSLVIGSSHVAIEIQRSDISIETIIQRTTRYTEMGVHIIWILPELHHDEYDRCRVKSWHKFLHRLQYGRVYIWSNGASVIPIHLDSVMIADYSRPSVTMRFMNEVPSIHLVKDFNPIQRSRFTEEERYMPASKIWLDNLDRWWVDEYHNIREELDALLWKANG